MSAVFLEVVTVTAMMKDGVEVVIDEVAVGVVVEVQVTIEPDANIVEADTGVEVGVTVVIREDIADVPEDVVVEVVLEVGAVVDKGGVAVTAVIDEAGAEIENGGDVITNEARGAGVEIDIEVDGVGVGVEVIVEPIAVIEAGAGVKDHIEVGVVVPSNVTWIKRSSNNSSIIKRQNAK